MKNKILIEAAAPANASQLSSNNKPFCQALRQSPVVHGKGLNHLRTQLRANMNWRGGSKWVWLDVSPARKPMLAKALWALGFH